MSWIIRRTAEALGCSTAYHAMSVASLKAAFGAIGGVRRTGSPLWSSGPPVARPADVDHNSSVTYAAGLHHLVLQRREQAVFFLAVWRGNAPVVQSMRGICPDPMARHRMRVGASTWMLDGCGWAGPRSKSTGCTNARHESTQAACPLDRNRPFLDLRGIQLAPEVCLPSITTVR